MAKYSKVCPCRALASARTTHSAGELTPSAGELTPSAGDSLRGPGCVPCETVDSLEETMIFAPPPSADSLDSRSLDRSRTCSSLCNSYGLLYSQQSRGSAHGDNQTGAGAES
eukprot:1668242-Pyramimonas_sp.AAC.1